LYFIHLSAAAKKKREREMNYQLDEDDDEKMAVIHKQSPKMALFLSPSGCCFITNYCCWAYYYGLYD
jgi:hypothetical protein